MLVAREFQPRTQSAFEFLAENGLPIDLIRATVYENEDGRRFVDIGGDHEPEFPVADVAEASRAAMEAARIPAYDGWLAWTVVRLGKRLNDLRHEFHDASVDSVDGAG